MNMIERVGAAILNECRHFGALAHKTPLELRLARAAIDAVLAGLEDARRHPPHPYFWPDSGVYETIEKVKQVLKEEA